ncbi:transposon Tf2-6 polyprotein [Trichonephila clavata]|uniref:RNA-directed DNA polymerase n=1 Tax=Trichonephila clavata TaxID=2740835 RepID=A0A8X6K8C9_TRICU|nr:transposon Tf2-6 polyprotein [Trichonephila clavata]
MLLKKHLTTKPLIIPSRHKFLNRKQNEGEGFNSTFALKGRVENEIDRLERKVLEKVESSVWATPVVPVVKTDGSIRLCADYSVTLNPNLIVPQHPLPRLEDIFAAFANPLKNLTKKNVRFLWSKDCQIAFEQIKKEICSPKVLVHYHPSLPLTLASGASPVGIGCALSHELRQETVKDIELGPLLKALREGKDLPLGEAQYTIEDGCIMYGQRVCIPKIFQKNVLEELYAGHLGTVKMKAIARSFVYWENIDKDIEEATKNCVHCVRYKADTTKAKVRYWEYPSMPWERIHVDFAGPVFEHTFFLIVDSHSKWLEVYPIKTTKTKKTIECLRDSFARFGLPRVLVSDNGSQFISYEFQRFMQRNGVKHKTSAPFLPSSNGQAERYVATL